MENGKDPVNFNFRLTRDERSEIIRFARSLGMTGAQYLRGLVYADIKKSKEKSKVK